jgi:steroid 5-alpha reductase family enzyme
MIGAVIALALLFVAVEMALTFLVARRLNNYGIVDVVWSAGFSGLAVLYYLATPRVAASDGIRYEVITLLAVLWSLRLGLHLAVRVSKHHPVEDVRYARLRELWGARTAWKMFGFFQLQGVLQAVLSMPFLLVCLNTGAPEPSWAGLSPLEWAGAALWLVALCGESIADLQLSRFRNNPANRGQVCQVGLWRWSRHPNYFFEWLIWVAWAVFAWDSPLGCLSLICPVLMWHFLVNVTGIPMTEELSVRSKGDAYREYQRTTSAFIPWFRKPLRSP